MKHFWPLTIAAVLFAFTAQAGQVNNRPTQTMQPAPTTSVTIHFEKIHSDYKAQDRISSGGHKLRQPTPAVQDGHGE
jgi:hypothetical protein